MVENFKTGDDVLCEMVGEDVLKFLWREEREALKAFIYGKTYEAVAKLFKTTRQRAHVKVKRILRTVGFYSEHIIMVQALEVVCDLLENEVELTKDDCRLLRELIVNRHSSSVVADKIGCGRSTIVWRLKNIRKKIAGSSEEFESFIQDFISQGRRLRVRKEGGGDE